MHVRGAITGAGDDAVRGAALDTFPARVAPFFDPEGATL